MLFIDNQQINDPSINLAIEEYALGLDQEETYLLFYINEPSIIIGRNQNTFEEINQEYVQEYGIHVVRRLSGGGAVYHDLGNLNFSFITKNDGDSFRNFRRFTEPVVEALQAMGVCAQLTGRNDLQIGEKKISGNAQFSTRGRMFSHGTLMFDVDLDVVTSALQVKTDKIASKGIKSIRSRVANIREYLRDDMSIIDFRTRLLKSIGEHSSLQEYKLTDQDWVGIHRLSDKRYRNWDWNYGKSPKSNVGGSKRFPIGSIDIRLDVQSGKIAGCKIYGDFFGMNEIADVEQALLGCRYDPDSVSHVLSTIDLKTYFGDITVDDILGLFW